MFSPEIRPAEPWRCKLGETLITCKVCVQASAWSKGLGEAEVSRAVPSVGTTDPFHQRTGLQHSFPETEEQEAEIQQRGSCEL